MSLTCSLISHLTVESPISCGLCLKTPKGKVFTMVRENSNHYKICYLSTEPQFSSLWPLSIGLCIGSINFINISPFSYLYLCLSVDFFFLLLPQCLSLFLCGVLFPFILSFLTFRFLSSPMSFPQLPVPICLLHLFFSWS